MKGYYRGIKGLYTRQNTPDREQELPDLVAQGMSNYQIAALWNCGRDTVRKMRKRLGLPGRQVRKNAPATDTDTLNAVFLDEGRFTQRVQELELPQDCFRR